MKESFSGYKDTDREILLTLSDKDLLSICSSNKYFFTSVCDNTFFYQKLYRSYPNTLNCDGKKLYFCKKYNFRDSMICLNLEIDVTYFSYFSVARVNNLKF